MECRICAGELKSLGTVPFDKNNADVPVVNNTPIEYFKCSKCYCIVCPEMLNWTPAQLGAFIYNSKYEVYDPDYKTGARAKEYADFLRGLLPNFKGRHLDYGSGEGLLSKELGWLSTNYDPFSNTERPTGLFHLITAVEVFEHSTDLDSVIKDMIQYLDKRGAIYFSTKLSSKDIKANTDWSYVAPRNGHINIQSRESLIILAKKNNLFFDSMNDGSHVLQFTRNNFKDLQRGTWW